MEKYGEQIDCLVSAVGNPDISQSKAYHIREQLLEKILKQTEVVELSRFSKEVFGCDTDGAPDSLDCHLIKKKLRCHMLEVGYSYVFDLVGDSKEQP